MAMVVYSVIIRTENTTMATFDIQQACMYIYASCSIVHGYAIFNVQENLKGLNQTDR